MALSGQVKIDWEFVSYRAKKQTAIWAQLVEGNPEGLDLSKLDQEILGCCLTHSRFRGEGLSTEQLWHLYTGVKKLTTEEKERGKEEPKTKKEKIKEAVPVPISARRIAWWRNTDAKGIAIGDWTYGVHFHDDGYLDFPSWLFARDQARKDLLWLNREVLGNTLVDESVHRPICNQFVQKNFDGVYVDGYTVNNLTAAIGSQRRVPTKWDQDTRNYIPVTQTDLDDEDNFRKISMTQDARDFFKSTIGRADAIQWMLACPDVSMIILCADNNLSATFVKEIKKKFFLARGAQPSALHLLFPEYVLTGVKGTSDEPIECPARRIDRTYPTLWADSIDSTLSGLHCDVLKFDDVVSNTNCQTPATREKLKNHIETTLSVCDTWGWTDFIGTRYFPDDYYGFREAMVREDKDAFGIKLYVRAAFYVKPQFKDVEKKGLKYLEEHMVVLTFPSHASWKFLRARMANETTFRCQYLNQPVWGQESITFTDELLRSCYMNPVEAQRVRGEVYVCWDTAKEAKKNSDWSVGVALKIFENEDHVVSVVVLDVVYGKWTQADIAFNMAKLDGQWLPRVNQVEDTGGLDLLKKRVQDECRQRYGRSGTNFYWKPVENQEDAKRNRIKSLEILMRAGRFKFVVAPWNEEAFSQFVGYTGIKSTRTRKDDIPDACSFISKYLPSTEPVSAKDAEERADREAQMSTASLLREHHRRIFGNDAASDRIFVPPNVNYEPPEEEPSRYGDLAKKLFGGNGMRA